MAASRASKIKNKAAPSRLQASLAGRILGLLKDQDAKPGHHLVEQELCETFGVSRTPIRGALKILEAQGAVEARANRGFVLREPLEDTSTEPATLERDDEAKQLFIAIAQARNTGTLPDDVPQQEMIRRFKAKLPVVLQVLRQMADLGLVERRPGNGWSFRASVHSSRAQAESYAFRRAIEPALVLQPTFKLDRAWAQRAREAHLAFRAKRRGPADALEFYEINADFHEQLARCSGNRYMLHAVQGQIQLRRFLNTQWEYGVGRVQETIDEHLEILAALEAGWNDKASALMLHHLTTSATHTAPAAREA
jgi:DNA-binding GntR family transcriptional regulator